MSDNKVLQSRIIAFDNYLRSIRHDDYFDVQDTRKKFREMFGEFDK